jgi:AbrB family looped-hinge helix DNA binding protein
METTMTSKGQIVIPSRLRKKYGMEEGTRIEFIEDEKSGSLILKPITPQYVHSLRGVLRGKGGLEALKEDRQKEKDL